MAGGFSFGNPAPPTGGGGGFSFGTGSNATQPSFGITRGGTTTTTTASNSNSSSATLTTPNTNRCGPSSSTSVRALAWDPTGTASLSLCPLPSSSSSKDKAGRSNKDDDDVNLDVFLSHDATGCTTEETQCLLRCLDAREECIHRQQQSSRSRRRGDGSSTKGEAVTKLSMDYRAAMCECLMQLQSKAAAADEEDDADAAQRKGDGEESNNIELLSLTYAISHLAEIFLLPSLAPSASATTMSSYSPVSNNNFGDDGALPSRLDGPAGSLTADTVRYLRLHHSKGYMTDMPEVLDMLASDQPEYYQFPSNNNNIIPGPYDYPFWNLLLHFVIQGQLSNAWMLLSNHSACRHAEEEAEASIDSDTGGIYQLSPEGQGFAALRAMLLSAPLPGGRGDEYCDDAGLDDYLEEELLLEQEEEEASRPSSSTMEDDEENEENAEDPGDINQPLIDGVQQNSYLLWETLPRRADKLRTLRYRRDLRRCGRASDIDGSSESLESATVPEVCQPNVALNAIQVWQETVRVTAFPGGVGGNNNGGGALSALFKRFPPLQQILSILLGVVPPTIANDSSVMTWSETLLMELLYARPNIMPDDIAVRANVAMSKVGDGGGKKHALQEIILSIMNGSAGQVVETMFSLCGGSSGAALPATMTSLLCNLLVDAGCISPQKDSSKVNIQTELLILAAESILSSFSVQEQSDVGVRTAVRLLLPHAPPKRAPQTAHDAESSTAKDNIIYEPRIAAMISEALSHRLPAMDAEARDLIQLCEGAIQLGSVIIADACESVAFSRASYHRSNNSLNREVHWLLRGMEVQSCWLPLDRQRKLGFACRRRFDSLCEQSANDLIAMLSVSAITNFAKSSATKEQEKKMTLVLWAATEVLDGVLQDDVMAPVLKGHMEANLLKYAVEIALADAKGDTVQVATDIVHCLEERCLSEGDYGGVVSTIADPKMYAEFLHIAFAILVKEDESSEGGPMEFAKCAFSVHGMHILMARLTQVLSWEGIICSPQGTSSLAKKTSAERKEYFTAMRQAFCKGLMRSFVSTNPSTPLKMDNKKPGGEISLDEEMELMLSPCI
ncbi:hypothetical protein ACHAXR_010822 [Thalassiosira sp. AJA248-18]